MSNTLLKVPKIIAGIFIAFFKAITEVAWGLASIYLLVGLLAYFEIDTNSVIETFLQIAEFLFTYVLWFALAFFIFYLYKYAWESLE